MFGLFNLDSSAEFLLKSVRINCAVHDLIVGCNAVLVYENNTNNDSEALFLFPLEDDFEVMTIEANINGKMLIGQWKDKSEIFGKTLASEPKSVVIQYDKNANHLIKFRVGIVPKSSKVTMTLKFAINLSPSKNVNIEVDRFYLYLPLILRPVYSSNGKNHSEGAYRVQEKFEFAFEAVISGKREIKNIFSSGYNLNTTIESSNIKNAKVKLESQYDGKKDFDICIDYVKTNEISVMYHYGTTSKYVTDKNDNRDFCKADLAVLNFIPKGISSKLELVFMVDRSDSMYGEEMDRAKDCLQIFLKGLHAASMFQVYGFGTYYDKVFMKPESYDERSLKLAMDYQKKMMADYGGTDFMLPLKNMYSYPLAEGYSRVVFLLTDGDVTEKDEVIQLIKENNHSTTVHSVGIGCTISSSFIEKMAEAGLGKSAIVQDAKTLCASFTKLFNDALKTSEVEIGNVKWECGAGVSVTSISKYPEPVLPNNLLTLFCIVKGLKEGDTVKGNLGLKLNGQLRHLSIDISNKNGVIDRDFTAHHLLAKYQVLQMVAEMGKGNSKKKAELLKLSSDANVETEYSTLVSAQPNSTGVGLYVSDHMDPSHYYRPLFDVNSSSKITDGNISTDSSSYLSMQIWIRDSFKKSTHGDIVIYIADKQNINGSWDYDLEMIWRLGLDLIVVDDLRPDAISMEIWMTVIVFEFLSTKLHSREMEWRLLSKKAKEFILIGIKESSIMDEIQSDVKYEGARDIGGFIRYVTNLALLVLNEVENVSSQITSKEIDVVSSTEMAQRKKYEIVFVIDRSGSMNGLKIESAKQCLFIFLKSLPENCKFQIYGFGTKFDKAFNEYKEYTDDNIKIALTYQYKIDASFGNTQLLNPLMDLYRSPLPSDYSRLVFVMTDGKVGNENQVVDFVKQNSPSGRLFAIGVGKDVSKTLVNRMAEAGSGKAVFVEETSIFSSVVIDLLDQALNDN